MTVLSHLAAVTRVVHAHQTCHSGCGDKMTTDGALDLPKGLVKRIVKERLVETGSDGKDTALSKDALLAFAESAKARLTSLLLRQPLQ